MFFAAASFLFLGALSPLATPAWAQFPGERITIDRPAPRPSVQVPIALEPHQLACFASVPESLPRFSQESCPAGTGFRLLSNLHAPHSVFVTLQKNTTNDNSRFVAALIQLLEREAPAVRVQVMATRSEWDSAGLAAYTNAQLVPASRRLDFWAQDFMEFGVRGADAHASVLELNYRGRYTGGAAARLVADSCQEPVERIVDRTWAGHSGNHGGNMELFPGDVTVVGSNMDADVAASLARMGSGALFTFDTSWLSVGHVDELVTVVPSNRPCGFALAYASPRRAVSLMRASPELAIGAPILPGLPRAAQPFEPQPAAQVYLDEQMRLHQRVENELIRLKRLLASRTGCAVIPTLELPVLFSADREAFSLTPNPVNMLVLGDLAVVPKTFHAGFAAEIEKVLGEHGLRVRFLDDRFYHFQGGDIHCATQTLRSCR